MALTRGTLDAFFGALGDEGQADRVDRAAVEQALDDAILAARAAHPKVVLDPDVFAAAIARTLGTESVMDGLRHMQLTDFYLAQACVVGDKVAQRTIHQVHLSRVKEWIGAWDGREAFAADVHQEAARRLLVADGGPPQIASYTARGALGAFIRVYVTRLARKMKRGKADGAHAEPSLALRAPDLDPDVALLRRRYAREFADAFQATLLELSTDERNVLKLHYLDGLSIEQVGAAYQVSRATAARWLAKARDRVLEATRERLVERLGASAPNAASLLSIAQAEIGGSLFRMFGAKK
jgi:RNA polymerase sigma-70 factor, ECF subfamily